MIKAKYPVKKDANQATNSKSAAKTVSQKDDEKIEQASEKPKE